MRAARASARARAGRGPHVGCPRRPAGARSRRPRARRPRCELEVEPVARRRSGRARRSPRRARGRPARRRAVRRRRARAPGRSGPFDRDEPELGERRDRAPRGAARAARARANARRALVSRQAAPASRRRAAASRTNAAVPRRLELVEPLLAQVFQLPPRRAGAGAARCRSRGSSSSAPRPELGCPREVVRELRAPGRERDRRPGGSVSAWLGVAEATHPARTAASVTSASPRPDGVRTSPGAASPSG